MIPKAPKPEDEAAIDDKHDLMMDYVAALTEEGSPEEIFAKMLIADVLDHAATLMRSNGNDSGNTICSLLATGFRRNEVELGGRKRRRDIAIGILASSKDRGTFKQRVHGIAERVGASRTTVTNALALAKEYKDNEAFLEALMEGDAHGHRYDDIPLRDSQGVLTRAGTYLYRCTVGKFLR
jgi:hypothetical protein